MKIRKILAVFFVISISFAVYRILNILEINKIVENLHDSSCEIIGDIPGPEDFHIFNEKYLITISDEKLKLFELKGYNVDNLPEGGINLVDIESKRIIKLEIKDFPKNISFHPHGIYIYNDELYIINHAYSRGGERVEVFKLEDIEDNLLVKYSRSLVFPKQYSGFFNDLVVFKQDEFLITNWIPFADPPEGKDHSLFTSLKKMAIYILGIKYTYLYYCNGVNENNEPKCRIVENSNSVMNNGITYDNKNTIYVVDTILKELKVFKFDKTVDNLKLVETISIDYAIDNVYFDVKKNKIYLGVIGKIIDNLSSILSVKKNIENLKTSTFQTGGGTYDVKSRRFELNFMQNKYRGIASFIEFKNKYIAGSWYDKGVLICDK